MMLDENENEDDSEKKTIERNRVPEKNDRQRIECCTEDKVQKKNSLSEKRMKVKETGSGKEKEKKQSKERKRVKENGHVESNLDEKKGITKGDKNGVVVEKECVMEEKRANKRRRKEVSISGCDLGDEKEFKKKNDIPSKNELSKTMKRMKVIKTLEDGKKDAKRTEDNSLCEAIPTLSQQPGIIEVLAATKEVENQLLNVTYIDHKRMLVPLDQNETSWFQQV